MGKRPLNTADSGRIIDLLFALPHGVAAMSTEMKGLVETSNNEASVRITNSKLEIVTSQRSSVMSRLHALTWRIEAIARLAGANAVSGGGYPSWQPNLQSPLLARCKDVYRKLFGKEPHVEAIHAGLECGIIGDKKEGMDMISFGPTLKNPHSPDEKIHVESIGKVWDFMVELLKSLK
jgi:dipeptidase D